MQVVSPEGNEYMKKSFFAYERKIGRLALLIEIILTTRMASTMDVWIAVDGSLEGFTWHKHCNQFLKRLFEFERTLPSSAAIVYGLQVTGQSIIIRRFSFLPSKREGISPNDLLSSRGIVTEVFFLTVWNDTTFPFLCCHSN